ncbi:ribonuclease H-like domain-containing protein [Paraphysoderma sedebokerense]|nr:ribonuclease H-like domain-containing protein [Paraphysoderma sedebokerense]
MLQVPLSLAQKTLKEKARLQRAMNFSLHLFPVQNYVLTLEELIANDYPVHSNLLRSQVLGDEIPVDAEDWKEPVIPPSKVKPGESRKLLAVDCEMCYTSAGLELTRVSVIDESLQTVYDTLVKPERDILDYNTRYSGITAIQMINVTTTLQEVQEKLLDLIDEDTILMGHSLENDLRALKIKHPFIIDTALLYNSPSGPPAKPSLKHLASTFLKKTIQLNALQTSDNGTIHTHDSIEDARTVMELVKLKLERGPNFGVKESEYESIWEKIASGMVDEVHHDNSAGMNEREAEDKNSAKVGALIDYRSSCVKFGTGAKTVVTCHNDEEIMNGLLDTLRNDKEDRVVWARFRDLEVHYGTDFHTAETSTTNQTATSTSGPTPNVAGITSSPATRPLPFVQERSKPQQELRPTDPDAMDLEEGEIGDDEDDQMECEDSAKEAEAKRREHLDLIRVLSSLDERIRTIWEELPKKAAFIIFSGNGDMRKVASLTAKKQEYQRLFCTQPISKIPLSKQWSEDDQSELQRAVEVAKNGVAMMVVKE